MKKAYYDGGRKGRYELTLLHKKEIKMENKEVIGVFGNNRTDYYSLIPYWVTQAEGEVVVDWKKNREGFRVLKDILLREYGIVFELSRQTIR